MKTSDPIRVVTVTAEELQELIRAAVRAALAENTIADTMSVSAARAAKMVQVRTATILEALKNGELRGKLTSWRGQNGRWRIRVDELKRWDASR